MNGTKWAMLALIAFGLLIFGYKTHLNQESGPSQVNRGPIAVAAVRGSSEETAAAIAPASNAFVDYTKSLQDDVALAEKNASKYQAAEKAREVASKSINGDVGQ